MCLAVPAKILSFDNINAMVDIMGVRQKVNILLIDSPAIGDYILVHAGFAIEKIDMKDYEFLNEIFSDICKVE